MNILTWVVVAAAGLAAFAAIVLWRHSLVARRQSREFHAHAEQWRAAQQELVALLKQYLAIEEAKAAEGRQRIRDESLPRFSIASSPMVMGSCTVVVRNSGPTVTRVRMEFRPSLATGATPQFDACQTGTTQQFAAQFDADRPGLGDELRISYVDASGANGSETYGMARTGEGSLDFYLKRRERALWN